jgi:hypothetical protein
MKSRLAKNYLEIHSYDTFPLQKLYIIELKSRLLQKLITIIMV